jgi:hypothetical protein
MGENRERFWYQLNAFGGGMGSRPKTTAGNAGDGELR